MLFRTWFRLWLIVCGTAVIAGSCSSSPQMTFNSPQSATEALVSALRAHDDAKLAKIFGPDGTEILSSGDKVSDQAEVKRFLAAYDARHRLQEDSSQQSTLIVGEKDWPFPVPIVWTERGYVFDTAAGEDEILNRRVGRNELSAQEVCLAIVDAQREYVARRPMGGDLPLYARKIMSTPGKKDGLFWATAEGEPSSPLGPLVALAAEEGYSQRVEGKEPPPYHGYRYRVLTSQGPNAKGGTLNYEVDGQLVGGFGVVAYPADYGNSGIMTFITNHDGVVYQRDLGPDTEKTAKDLPSFDPDSSWKRTTDATQVDATE